METHNVNKLLLREHKQKDKERAITETFFCVAVFDLQQVLPIPKCEVNQVYYSKKLATYNLTVFDLGSKNCICFMWHEDIAAKGSNEIGSCIFQFIPNKVQEGVKEICLFMFCLYAYCSVKYGVIITHKFLEKGHTQNEGDSAHSIIERAAKNIPIYIPSQWCAPLCSAKRKKPYTVRGI
ncbi:hypothetical protein RN001_004459 [Aquatica leii]|uniref:Uncharacterized protein n=1 Tax=Aquatica leii TaxID=1421715 RepID=A0AAN7P5D4_9COLE|nr:hypothetical protein RN001_004459 [Aquatica leii]